MAETEVWWDRVLRADGPAHWWVNTEVLRSGFLLLLWVGLSKHMTHPVLRGPEPSSTQQKLLVTPNY